VKESFPTDLEALILAGIDIPHSLPIKHQLLAGQPGQPKSSMMTMTHDYRLSGFDKHRHKHQRTKMMSGG